MHYHFPSTSRATSDVRTKALRFAFSFIFATLHERQFWKWSRTLRPSISELRRPFAPAWILDSAQTESSSATRDLGLCSNRINFRYQGLGLCARVNSNRHYRLRPRLALLNRMPYNMDPYAASLLEETRKKMMAALCRLAARAPIEAAEAYLNLRPYEEHQGFVYTHLRPNWEVLDNAPNVPMGQLDWVDIKVGKAEVMEDRQLGYESTCVGEPIAWAFCYETSRPKLIERLTHLTLWEMGAKRVPYACRGCGVRHRCGIDYRILDAPDWRAANENSS
ncbi:hypothetical protein C8R47DRAFT_1085177 [Mycena vitilis]|nr:hypothetical protein C8R47DRAFT_1085189 [Mycena vitilis]KAJ6447779.1 hypothetical protein C8R47DRAFT_1085177 [Mycena vitilis]